MKHRYLSPRTLLVLSCDIVTKLSDSSLGSCLECSHQTIRLSIPHSADSVSNIHNMRNIHRGLLRSWSLRRLFSSGSGGKDDIHYLESVTNKLLDGNTLYQLDRYSRYTPAPISIKHLLDHGKHSDTRGSYLFLKKEIPTR